MKIIVQTRIHQLIRTLEQQLFSHRVTVIAVFALITIVLGYRAAHLRPEASINKMLPAHPYISNYLRYENQLRPLGQVVRIAVATTQGNIYNAEFLHKLKQISDEVFYVKGVDRGTMKSLWTPNVHWYEVTEHGLESGLVIPAEFDGTAKHVDQVRRNVVRSNLVGSLVANDHRSTLILVPVLELDPDTGEKLDYARLAGDLETRIRDRYESLFIKIHITGAAKVIGELVIGARQMSMYFALTVLTTILVLSAYWRCWRSVVAVVACSVLAVVWQLGIAQWLGFGINPFSLLVPFLIFAISVSHAIQNVNVMMQSRVRGIDTVYAARETFRTLFTPGTTALIANAVGFAAMTVIPIVVIREIAVCASIGVAIIICTKMLLLPVLMSYIGISPTGMGQARWRAAAPHRTADMVSNLTHPFVAKVVAATALVAFGIAWYAARNLQIGDLDSGAPELRVDSRYNVDNRFISENYASNSDVFIVLAITPPGECGSYTVAEAVDRLQWDMENLAGVESTWSLFSAMKHMIVASNAGNLKWAAITRDRYIANSAHRKIPSTLYNAQCSMVPILVFLSNHTADTLTRVMRTAERFADENSNDRVRFELLAGNAGIEAVTNVKVAQSKHSMLLVVFMAVGLLVWIEFKSWRVVVCILVPLYYSSVLAEAVMAMAGIGLKISTLPVIALGAGIGVDYGIYIYNRFEGYRTSGVGEKEAVRETLRSTGAAVFLTAMTLTIGVFTWFFSEIKFQADMGLLLAFLFMWNMIAAVVLVPVLIRLLNQRMDRVPVPFPNKRI